MSKSSAPTAATPRMPSVARAGWRTRLRHANGERRDHRRASLSPLRRSSAHDAATVATAPSGTAMARQMAATSGVILHENQRRVVSPLEEAVDEPFRRRTRGPARRARRRPAMSTPSSSTWTRMRRAGRPISRSTPTVARRSSTSMMLSASRKTVAATIVTAAMARWKRSRTTNVLPAPAAPIAPAREDAGHPRVHVAPRTPARRPDPPAPR